MFNPFAAPSSQKDIIDKDTLSELPPIPASNAHEKRRSSIRSKSNHVRKNSLARPPTLMSAVAQPETVLEDIDDEVSQKSKLTAEEIQHYKESFELFDKDGNGCIDVHELAEALRSAGFDPPEEQIRHMIDSVDVDKTGTIDFNEFME